MNFLSFINDNKMINFDDYPIAYRKDLYENVYLYLHSDITYEELIKRIKISEMIFYIDYKEDINKDNFGFLSNFIIDIDDTVTEAIICAKYDFNITEENFKNKFDIKFDKKEDAIDKIKQIIYTKYSTFLKLNIYAINPKISDDVLIKEHKDFTNLFKIYKIVAERSMGESEIVNNSPFCSLMSKLFDEDIDSSFPDLTDKIKEIQKYVSENNEAAQRKVNDCLTDILQKAVKFGYPNEKNIELKAKSNIQMENQIKKNTDLNYLDNKCNEILPNSYNGLGYKNLIKIEFELAAFAREIKKFSNSVLPILFIEEPESHMHPQIQQKFVKYLNDYLKEINEIDIQVIVTSHSAHISSEVNFNAIRYVKRKANRAEFKNLDNFAAQDENNLDFIKKYLTLTKCDMFFADKIILVEGITEKILIPDMIKKCFDKKKFDKNSYPLIYQYYSIIEVGGAYAHKFIKFIKFLEIPTLIITDIDSVKKVKNDNGKLVNKKCLVLDGETTSNATIKYWIKSRNIIKNNDKISITKLLSIPDKEKTDDFIHIEYQVPEKGFCGRSLEEAIMNVNRAQYDYNSKDVINFDSNENKKTNFALDLLMKEKYVVPKYIENGLVWLNNYDCSLIGDTDE